MDPMNVSGPLPVQPQQNADSPALALRQNQRVTAEVLQVAGQRVLLAVDGVPVVARLTTPEGAVALAERRFARFIVRDLSGPAITLQWIRPGGSPTEPGGSMRTLAQLLPELLRQAGLPEDAARQAIARALLAHGLPMNGELVEEIRQALLAVAGRSAASADGELASLAAGAASTQTAQPPGLEPQAAAAAALKALGLPLTPGTLALAAGDLPPLIELLAVLQAQLRGLRARPGSSLAGAVQAALELLDELAIDLGANPEDLAQMLRQSTAGLGRALEASLKQEAVAAGQAPGAPAPLLALVRLRNQLAQAGGSPLLEDIDRFLDGVRRLQLFNAAPTSEPVKGQWLRLDLPLAFPAPYGSQVALHTGKLRIAYCPDSDPPTLDPAHTRIILRVDLDPGEIVQVDLSVVDQRVGARVTSSNPSLQARAEEALPELQAGLERLGYRLQSISCELDRLGLNESARMVVD